MNAWVVVNTVVRWRFNCGGCKFLSFSDVSKNAGDGMGVDCWIKNGGEASGEEGSPGKEGIADEECTAGDIVDTLACDDEDTVDTVAGDSDNEEVFDWVGDRILRAKKNGQRRLF